LPAVKALRKKYNEANLDILVVRRAVPVAQDAGLFNRVYDFNRNIPKLTGLLLELRNNRYDLVINMRSLVTWKGALKMFLVLQFIHGRINAGRDTDHRGFFFDIKTPETTFGQKYEMQYDIDTVRALGAESVDTVPNFPLDLKDTQEINDFLKNSAVNEKDILIGLHPGGMPSRRWPVENFIRVISKVRETIDCKFVVTGTKQEALLLNIASKHMGLPLIDAADKLNLRQFGALIKRCDVFISNDTGPMHIAAILKAPLIAIFGPGEIIRFDPRNIYDKAIVFYKKAPCAPCNKTYCDSLKCFKDISAEEVAIAAVKLIKERNNA